jgi:alkylation response protein AidB-like acyl-CoA dehydrogenase
MDFSYSPKEEAFRQEVRDWLEENMKELPKWWFDRNLPRPDTGSEEYQQFSLWWHRKLYYAGFVGIGWPKEYGGRGATLLEQVVFNEEMSKHRTPGPTNVHGIGWCGPAIMVHGAEWQKKRYLPKILSAEEIWCTCYSEPEAGSDMANVQTRAVEDGDDFVVNGQKVWTSGGHYSDWAVILVRTDPDAPKHRGLSYLIMDMHSSGITVRPLRQITGHAEYNEVFLDNVRIPKSHLVGQLNRGWYIAAGALEFERSNIGASERAFNTVKDMIQMAQQTERKGMSLSQDPVMRQKLAQLYVEAMIMRYNGLRNLTSQLRGEPPGPQMSIGKLYMSEHDMRAQHVALEIQGHYSQLTRGSKYAIEAGRWQQSFLSAPGMLIAEGTSEIQRNVIAQRVLGLPR